MNCFSRRSVVVFLLRFGGGRCATSTPRPSLMLSFFSLMLSVSRLDSLFFFLVLALCVFFFYYSSRSRHLHSHLSLFALGFAFFFFPVHVQENDNERESPICGWRHCDCYSSTWIHETLFFFFAADSSRWWDSFVLSSCYEALSWTLVFRARIQGMMEGCKAAFFFFNDLLPSFFMLSSFQMMFTLVRRKKKNRKKKERRGERKALRLH